MTLLPGTRGDGVWETQNEVPKDLVGAIAALLLLSRIHDRVLAGVDAEGELSA